MRADGTGRTRLHRWRLVAALAPAGHDVIRVFTGASERDAAHAADALRRDARRGRFAVVLADNRVRTLPVP